MKPLTYLPVLIAVSSLLPVAARAVLLFEDFSPYGLGDPPVAASAINAGVIDGSTIFGTGQALALSDPGTTGSTSDKVAAYEVNFASSAEAGFEAIALSFDLYNDQPAGATSSMIFGVAGFSDSSGIVLNATSSRFFNLEFSSNSSVLKVRTTAGTQGTLDYLLGAPSSIALFINDGESGGVIYERPDTAELDTLPANSFALFVDREAFGVAPLGSLAEGASAGLGRVGFYSGTSVISGFTIDNLVVEDLSSAPLSTIPEAGWLPLAAGLLTLLAMVARRRRSLS